MDFNFKEVGIQLPSMSDIENLNYDELKAVAKFRHHESGWEWYVIAGDNFNDNDLLLFCYVRGDFNEMGSVMMSSIIGAGAMFCPTFKPVKVADLD